jgi:hypothetical protein
MFPKGVPNIIETIDCFKQSSFRSSEFRAVPSISGHAKPLADHLAIA